MTHSSASTRTASACGPRTAIRCGCCCPGFEGNMNVKWLRQLKLVAAPVMARNETSKYTVLLKDEKAWQFVFPMEVKSVITRPSPGTHVEGTRILRDFGARLVGQRQHQAGRRLGRRRQELGAGRLAGPDPVEGAGALPRGVAMERRAGCAAKPRHRRHRHGAADTRAVRGRTRSCGASTTTTPLQAGASTRRGRRPMSTA